MKHEPLPIQADSPEARTARRSHGMLAATVEVGGLKTPVRLRNVSRTGALVDGRIDFAPGTSVSLRRRETSVPSKLVWVQEDSAGLRFDRDLDDTALELLSLSKSKAPAATSPSGSAPLDPALRLQMDKARKLVTRLGTCFPGDPGELHRLWGERRDQDLVIHLLEQITKLVTQSDILEPL